jgi:predicted small metal-binding protein
MIIKYACKDMGLNCTFTVKGATVEEVTRIALEHVREKHSENFNSIHSPAEIQQMEQALARSTRLVG